MNIIKDDSWHLKKEISIGHIVSTVMIVLAMIGYAAGIENRLTKVETNQIAQDSRADRSEFRNIETLKEIKTALIRIEDKLEKK